MECPGKTPKTKIFSFSISYESLCTTFPQLWINDIKDKEGKKLRINLLYSNREQILTPSIKKIKSFLIDLFFLCQLRYSDHSFPLFKSDQPHPLSTPSLNGDVHGSQTNNFPLVGDDH